MVNGSTRRSCKGEKFQSIKEVSRIRRDGLMRKRLRLLEHVPEPSSERLRQSRYDYRSENNFNESFDDYFLIDKQLNFASNIIISVKKYF